MWKDYSAIVTVMQNTEIERSISMTILKAENLKKYYPLGNTVVKALDGVNLSVEKGEFLSIVGKSGSGKSTLLHIQSGISGRRGRFGRNRGRL